MAGTAKPKPKRDHRPAMAPEASDRYMSIAGKIAKMSGPEFLASLRRAGIITADGTLQAKYKKR
jgi:hypothetical protein